MERIECIDGLDYDQVMFRKEICDLIRHNSKSRVDYVDSIYFDYDVSNNTRGYVINYYLDGRLHHYHDHHGDVAKKISEFYKIHNRIYKLNQLGIK